MSSKLQQLLGVGYESYKSNNLHPEPLPHTESSSHHRTISRFVPAFRSKSATVSRKPSIASIKEDHEQNRAVSPTYKHRLQHSRSALMLTATGPSGARSDTPAGDSSTSTSHGRHYPAAQQIPYRRPSAQNSTFTSARHSPAGSLYHLPLRSVEQPSHQLPRKSATGHSTPRNHKDLAIEEPRKLSTLSQWSTRTPILQTPLLDTMLINPATPGIGLTHSISVSGRRRMSSNLKKMFSADSPFTRFKKSTNHTPRLSAMSSIDADSEHRPSHQEQRWFEGFSDDGHLSDASERPSLSNLKPAANQFAMQERHISDIPEDNRKARGSKRGSRHDFDHVHTNDGQAEGPVFHAVTTDDAQRVPDSPIPSFRALTDESRSIRNPSIHSNVSRAQKSDRAQTPRTASRLASSLRHGQSVLSLSDSSDSESDMHAPPPPPPKNAAISIRSIPSTGNDGVGRDVELDALLKETATIDYAQKEGKQELFHPKRVHTTASAGSGFASSRTGSYAEDSEPSHAASDHNHSSRASWISTTHDDLVPRPLSSAKKDRSHSSKRSSTREKPPSKSTSRGSKRSSGEMSHSEQVMAVTADEAALLTSLRRKRAAMQTQLLTNGYKAAIQEELKKWETLRHKALSELQAVSELTHKKKIEAGMVHARALSAPSSPPKRERAQPARSISSKKSPARKRARTNEHVPDVPPFPSNAFANFTFGVGENQRTFPPLPFMAPTSTTVQMPAPLSAPAFTMTQFPISSPVVAPVSVLQPASTATMPASQPASIPPVVTLQQRSPNLQPAFGDPVTPAKPTAPRLTSPVLLRTKSDGAIPSSPASPEELMRANWTNVHEELKEAKFSARLATERKKQSRKLSQTTGSAESSAPVSITDASDAASEGSVQISASRKKQGSANSSFRLSLDKLGTLASVTSGIRKLEEAQNERRAVPEQTPKEIVEPKFTAVLDAKPATQAAVIEPSSDGADLLLNHSRNTSGSSFPDFLSHSDLSEISENGSFVRRISFEEPAPIPDIEEDEEPARPRNISPASDSAGSMVEDVSIVRPQRSTVIYAPNTQLINPAEGTTTQENEQPENRLSSGSANSQEIFVMLDNNIPTSETALEAAVHINGKLASAPLSTATDMDRNEAPAASFFPLSLLSEREQAPSPSTASTIVPFVTQSAQSSRPSSVIFTGNSAHASPGASRIPVLKKVPRPSPPSRIPRAVATPRRDRSSSSNYHSASSSLEWSGDSCVRRGSDDDMSMASHAEDSESLDEGDPRAGNDEVETEMDSGTERGRVTLNGKGNVKRSSMDSVTNDVFAAWNELGGERTSGMVMGVH